MTLAKRQVKAQLPAYLARLPITDPVHLKILAYRHTKRKIDLSNIYAAVEDMLQKHGVLKDDAQVESHDGSRKFYGVPAEMARVEIEITELP
jgi:Holliday junction resolvase RusA-like endonuclease